MLLNKWTPQLSTQRGFDYNGWSTGWLESVEQNQVGRSDKGFLPLPKQGTTGDRRLIGNAGTRARVDSGMKDKPVTIGENRRRRTPVGIYAIGHSTMPIERFVKILRAHSVTMLVDIRTVPRSRHNPQFNSDSLEESLKHAGMEYVHLKELGGLRSPVKDSENTGWRNLSFRGYADHMQTEEFEAGLDRLASLSTGVVAAMMCAEGNPYRCHRSLVADALTARGIRVVHVSSGRPGRLHALTPFASVTGERMRYPNQEEIGDSGPDEDARPTMGEDSSGPPSGTRRRQGSRALTRLSKR
jgi:uncharacterized protein DUF488